MPQPEGRESVPEMQAVPERGTSMECNANNIAKIANRMSGGAKRKLP